LSASDALQAASVIYVVKQLAQHASIIGTVRRRRFRD
jgi:hypothetical protein